MNEADAIDLARDAVWTAVVVAAPMLIAGILVGVTVAFMQALTQVQEMTLTFVPKIGAILVVAIATAPFIFSSLARFTLSLYDRVATGF